MLSPPSRRRRCQNPIATPAAAPDAEPAPEPAPTARQRLDQFKTAKPAAGASIFNSFDDDLV